MGSAWGLTRKCMTCKGLRTEEDAMFKSFINFKIAKEGLRIDEGPGGMIGSAHRR